MLIMLLLTRSTINYDFHYVIYFRDSLFIWNTTFEFWIGNLMLKEYLFSKLKVKACITLLLFLLWILHRFKDVMWYTDMENRCPWLMDKTILKSWVSTYVVPWPDITSTYACLSLATTSVKVDLLPLIFTPFHKLYIYISRWLGEL